MSAFRPQAQLIGIIISLLGINVGIMPEISVSNPPEAARTAQPASSQAASDFFDGVSCPSAKACTAVGESITNAGIQETLAERWNGNDWSVQSTPNPDGAQNSGLTAVSCASMRACTAVGAFTSGGFGVPFAEQWDGVKWVVEPVPDLTRADSTSELTGVSCASADACMAAGYYVNSAGDVVTLADYWNGARWSAVTTPNPAGTDTSILNAVSCTRKKACTAVGYYNGNNAQLLLAERWNGKVWAIQTIPDPPDTTQSFPRAISCASRGTCMTAGGYVSGLTDLTLAEERDRGDWAIRSTTNPSDSQNLFLGLSCPGRKACTGVGYSINNQGAQVALAENWNGAAWTTETTPDPGGERNVLIGVSCPSASECIAVGLLQLAQGPELTLAERWDGTQWVLQPTPSLASAKRGANGIQTKASSIAPSSDAK
jgi:hypothetical protein